MSEDHTPGIHERLHLLRERELLCVKGYESLRSEGFGDLVFVVEMTFDV